ncbi:1-acyl-sn-glycerol-3-phosphate acyltransferase [Marinicella rhabdoformis]|uniref:1-acyl-sn-glycerol-3-phosphate acyltransferase n=1 Tax=Marinicella rhabdoformis TaxID=2580566 RepID=UPI001C55271D|nr:1-acyl-sn-glycerol-3-phosphate acyltransferase [Marinicella rhabdoformis]
MSKKNLQIRDKTIFDGFIVKYILKLFFKVWFKLAGWKPIKSDYEGAGITIAAPHTSNWDVFYAMGAAVLFDIKIYFTIKESWCRIPVIGRLMMWMGSIPINRSGSQGQIDKIKRFVDKHKGRQIFFLFTPEGTRGKVEKWKTGFYHVADGCDLPIFLAKVDFKNKESGVFHTYKLTGNKEEDIRSIQESYKKIHGKFPELQFPEYTGPMPELSDMEAKILKAVYSAKGVATRLDISAKLNIAAKLDQASKGLKSRIVRTSQMAKDAKHDLGAKLDIAGKIQANKLKAQELSTAMLEFLVEKGVLEKTENEKTENAKTEGSHDSEPHYKLTFAGRGCLLHLYPALH